MDEATIKEAKSLLEAGKVDEAMVLISRRDPLLGISPEFMGLMTDFRSLPNSIATALRRDDLSKLSTRELMETLFFVRNTIARSKKSDFLTRKVLIALSNLAKRIQLTLEGDTDG